MWVITWVRSAREVSHPQIVAYLRTKRRNNTSPPQNKPFLRTSPMKTKKPALRLACSVDQTPKFSNLLEDLWKVERFAQYIENQASENMAEMEGSEIKQ